MRPRPRRVRGLGNFFSAGFGGLPPPAGGEVTELRRGGAGYALVDTLRSKVAATVAPTAAGREPTKVPVPVAISYLPVPPRIPRVAATVEEPSGAWVAAPCITVARV